jgi:processive 1,2-diacylglycerol beta-glucosyltransferase
MANKSIETYSQLYIWKKYYLRIKTMSKTPKKHGIAILYLSAGSGHQIAAKALADALKVNHSKLRVVAEDPFTEKFGILPPVFNALQAISTIIAPDAYDTAWRRKVNYDSYKWVADIKILQEFLIEWITRHRIDTVIATHALPCVLAVGLKRRLSIGKVFGVITDYGVNSLWPTNGVNGYFVASEELKNVMAYRGVSSDTIHITGIPIGSKPTNHSIKPISKKLGVLLVGGGVRGGGYIGFQNYYTRLLNTFTNHDLDKIDITIVTGHQKQLKESLIKYKQKSKLHYKVLGFVNNMPNLMSTNDVIITKPGGLIITESLAYGMCIILSQSGAGQEGANEDFLVRHGAVFNGEDPVETAELLRHLSKNINTVKKMKLRAKRLGHPNSSFTVTKIILDALAL